MEGSMSVEHCFEPYVAPDCLLAWAGWHCCTNTLSSCNAQCWASGCMHLRAVQGQAAVTEEPHVEVSCELCITCLLNSAKHVMCGESNLPPKSLV